MELITRKEARTQGLTRYFTGKPCKDGHIAEHQVKGMCVECRSVYRKNNSQEIREYNAVYRVDNKEKLRYSRRVYSATYQSNHPEKIRARSAAYRKANIDKINSGNRNRKSKKHRADGYHTAADIQSILDKQEWLCNACAADLEITGYHVDHIIPISKGGSNWPNNLQALCPYCNLSKRDKMPGEWGKTILVESTGR